MRNVVTVYSFGPASIRTLIDLDGRVHAGVHLQWVLQSRSRVRRSPWSWCAVTRYAVFLVLLGSHRRATEGLVNLTGYPEMV